ncbi:unnamed protein product [Danaus chrysippus]|uniref:(African queen) hypothetical protein n=1 Tax=Danaus chrysippus TaxID=151541 RepID=A0A8J2VT46_9NEOP|nr:unnamed protein product [Danaus chrysippus]
MPYRSCEVSGDSPVMDFKDGKSIGSNSSGETNSTLRCRLLIGCGWRRRDGGGTSAWLPSPLLHPPPTDDSKLILFGGVIKLGPVRGRGGCQAALQLGSRGGGCVYRPGYPPPGMVQFSDESRAARPCRDATPSLVR